MYRIRWNREQNRLECSVQNKMEQRTEQNIIEQHKTIHRVEQNKYVELNIEQNIEENRLVQNDTEQNSFFLIQNNMEYREQIRIEWYRIEKYTEQNRINVMQN